ncbi:MAG TPA: efflux transporter outer membrane subunit [Gammaproteobacteria bacterium]|nr:efflux transporter outer membrane subunit [Gammaproteobacteria bacterium]
MRGIDTLRRALPSTMGMPLRLAPVTVLAGCITLAKPPTSDELAGQVLPDGSPAPSHWTAGGTTPGSVEAGWLATFADTDLDALVAEALAHNADLQAAAARVEQAAGYVRAAGGKLYPSLNFLARGGNELADNSGLEGGLISASWELDVWGRVRYAKRGANAQYAASEADFAYARQSLAALVAKSWFLATEATVQRRVASDMVDAAAKLLELAEQRFRVGAASELDVTTARINLDTYRDGLRQLDLSRDQALRSLELLVGRYPAAALAPAAELGVLPPGAPAGLPSELLERRPDLLAAEQRVAAAFNLAREAKAARLPSFSLTASVSDLSSEFFVLKNRDNPVWSLGGSVFAPLFNGGELKAKVEIRTAEQKEAMAHYVQTALKAFGDVENALSSEYALADREQILNAAVADAERALQLAQTRYRIGSGDLRQVEQQQLAYYSSRMNLLRVQSDRRVQRVNLHLALGGDFAPSA